MPLFVLPPEYSSRFGERAPAPLSWGPWRADFLLQFGQASYSVVSLLEESP